MILPKWNGIILRYDEIALKGANRNAFEKRLELNIKHLLKSLEIPFKHYRIRGRMWFTKKDLTPFSDTEFANIKIALGRAFGLSSFSPILFLEPKWELIHPLMVELTTNRLQKALEETTGKVSFRLRVRRANKRFPLESRQCEIKIVEALPNLLDASRLKVDLINADITIGLEIREEMAFIFFDDYPGVGGLPVGSNEDVLTLLSGGIDSPVAAWRIMKRGCHSDFITFDSYPYTPEESVNKVKSLALELCKWQGPSTLYICNIIEIQKAIRDRCDPRFRTVLYRRMMMRIATAVAKIFHYGALVTGEAVGQVASQTVTNINTIGEASGLEILRPLCGMDKTETIDLANKIGTFELSKTQVPDSCTIFAPPSPATKSRLWQIKFEEEQLGDVDALIEDALHKIIRYFPTTNTTKGGVNDPENN